MVTRGIVFFISSSVKKSVKTLHWRLQKNKKLGEEGDTWLEYGVGFPWGKKTTRIKIIGQTI